MGGLELKIKLVSECRKLQQHIVDNLRQEMTEAQQSANEYGPPKDRYDSFRMQLLRKKDMFGQQLEKALAELFALDKIDLKKQMSGVGFGAAVVTKDMRCFISIGLGKVIVDGEQWFAVSIKVPIAMALIGKQKGDITECNGKKMEILEVF